jgi:formylglycine-generating enzyme required for sulfatase activity
MPKIFLSYRRQDSAAMTGRIYDRLCAHFGEDAIFMDIDSIPFGLDFREHIRLAVDQCGVMLAVIGRNWGGQAEASRRIDDPRDFVRIELEVALERNVPVIPVLIDRTPMPAEADLPPSLGALAYRNAIDVDQWRDFHPHVDRLIRGIEYLFERAGKTHVAPPGEHAQPIAPLLPVPQPTRARAEKPVETASPSRPKPAVESRPVPAPQRRGPAVASRQRGAPPRWWGTPWPWVCAAAVPLLAVLGVIAHFLTDTRAVQTQLELTNSLGMKLIRIEPGVFRMGSPDTEKGAEDDEKPQHRVRITRPFYLGVHEVTRGQFRRFVDDAGYRTEQEKDGRGGWGWNERVKKFEQNRRYTWQNPGFEQTDLHPVVNVSWNDAVAFIKWLSQKEGKSYRLPTEAEWEYACRAGTMTRWSCGDDPEDLAEVGNVADVTAKTKYPEWTEAIAAQDGFVYTAPVGHFRPNAWGLFDMHGNAWEWCSDEYDAGYYKHSPADDPVGAVGAGPYRVFRGGGFANYPHYCRSAYRRRNTPDPRNGSVGFRLALVP